MIYMSTSNVTFDMVLSSPSASCDMCRQKSADSGWRMIEINLKALLSREWR